MLESIIFNQLICVLSVISHNHFHDANANWQGWTEATLHDLHRVPWVKRMAECEVCDSPSRCLPPSEIDLRPALSFPG